MFSQFTEDPAHPVMGAALHLPLPSGLKAGQKVKAIIHYKTTKDCMALQWLDKEYVVSRPVSLYIDHPYS